MTHAQVTTLVERLLAADRGASEAEDRKCTCPLPIPDLSDEQCAAMDECGGIEA